MRSALQILRLFLLPLVAAMAVALFVRANCFRVFAIPSDSMAPTLVTGDQIAVTPYRTLFRDAEPALGDVIVFRRPGEGWFVKRIVGAQGDHLDVRRGRLRRNGHTLAESYLPVRETLDVKAEIVPAASYYVLGDNRGDSRDSRVWGTVSRDDVYGRARMVLWSSAALRWNEPARAEGGSAPLWQHPALKRARMFRAID
jgi:signal peptidase I